MTFVVRQLAEKAVEHKARQFFTFVDLKQAYDSVPRGEAMRKLSVPEVLDEIVMSFHEGWRQE